MDHPRHHHYNHRTRSHPWRGHPRSDSWKNRSHPSERDRPRDSWPEKYRSPPRQDRNEMCASHPLHPDNPFYHLYLHKDPLGLAIDQRRTDVVIQGAAINVATFHSHPTTMEKIDTMFLRQQVSYLEHVIKAMKDVITKHQKELQPLDVTVERDTMRQKAALKRKEEFPQEESEKEEGELEEDTPKRKKMKLNTEKRDAVKKPQDPFMGLPISEEEEYKPEIKKNEAKQLPITASCFSFLSSDYGMCIDYDPDLVSEKERDKAMRKAKEDERLSNILLDDDFFTLKKEDLISDFQKKDCQIVTRCAEDSPFVRKYSKTLLKPS